MKTLTLYFINVEQVHLGKDVFLTPYYLGKELGCKVRIVYPMKDSNTNLPSTYKGVKLIPVSWCNKPIKNRFLRQLAIFLYLFRYMIPSHYAMLFHYYRMDTVYYGVLYKILNPFGKLYVKLDADTTALKYTDDYRNALERTFKNFFHMCFSKVVNCVSCETTVAMNAIKTSKATCYRFKDNMTFMPNGFDEEELESLGIKLRKIEEKEKILITVGRIGTYQKNNEMLLEALKNIDLNDWKFIIIGGIEKDFEEKITALYEARPDMKNKVIFTGNITSKKELWEYYNRSKVLVMTSRFESGPLVFPEAARFYNYLVSTNVGSYSDMLSHFNVKGTCIEQGDSMSLAMVLSDIVHRGILCDVGTYNTTGLSWASLVKPVACAMKK